jgi:hypothetical protein
MQRSNEDRYSITSSDLTTCPNIRRMASPSRPVDTASSAEINPTTALHGRRSLADIDA